MLGEFLGERVARQFVAGRLVPCVGSPGNKALGESLRDPLLGKLLGK
jgi:hypothetical protein